MLCKIVEIFLSSSILEKKTKLETFYFCILTSEKKTESQTFLFFSDVKNKNNQREKDKSTEFFLLASRKEKSAEFCLLEKDRSRELLLLSFSISSFVSLGGSFFSCNRCKRQKYPLKRHAFQTIILLIVLHPNRAKHATLIFWVFFVWVKLGVLNRLILNYFT